MTAESKTGKKSAPRKYSAPAVEKSLDILELLSVEAPIGLSLTNISKALNRTNPEIFRMVMVLLNRGYVEYSPRTRNYRLSHRMFEVSHQHVAVKSLTHAAAPVMASLASAIRQNCQIMCYSQGRLLVLAQQECELLVERLTVPVGSTRPLVGSSPGHIVLTYANDEERQDMLKGAKIKAGRGSRTARELSQVFERVEKQGYEILPNLSLAGVTDISYPLFDYAGLLSGAFVVSYLEYLDKTSVPDIQAILPQIEAAAQDISARLGFFNPPPDKES